MACSQRLKLRAGDHPLRGGIAMESAPSPKQIKPIINAKTALFLVL
jgi:hypothetical protein